MIERSVVEVAVQECSQSVDETMYVENTNFSPMLEVLSNTYFKLFSWEKLINRQHFYSGYFLVFPLKW